jgi:hypothetical protein
MSVQRGTIPSLYASACPIVITKYDNILSYQTASGVITPKNNNGSPVNCFPTDYSLSLVYTSNQLNLCCGNILSKKTTTLY